MYNRKNDKIIKLTMWIFMKYMLLVECLQLYVHVVDAAIVIGNHSCSFQNGKGISSKEIYIRNGSISANACLQKCLDLKIKNPLINGFSINRRQRERCSCHQKLKKIQQVKASGKFFFTYDLQNTASKIKFSSGEGISSLPLVISTKSMLIRDCVRKCQFLKNNADKFINGITIKSRQVTQQVMYSNLRTIMCRCERNMTRVESLQSCFILSPKGGKKRKTSPCNFVYGRANSQYHISPFNTGGIKINSTECVSACKVLQLNNSDIDGVTMYRSSKALCRCEVGMVGRFIFYSCTFDKKGNCHTNRGELVPDSKIKLPVTSDISTNDCIQKCKKEKMKNSFINGITVNDLKVSSICWCNINATTRRNYKSCFMKLDISSVVSIPTTTTATSPTTSITLTATTPTTTSLPTSITSTTAKISTSKVTTPKKAIEENLRNLTKELKNITLCNHLLRQTSNCTRLEQAVTEMNNAVFNRTSTLPKEKKTDEIRKIIEIVQLIVNVSSEDVIKELTPVIVQTINHLIGTNVEEIATKQDVDYISTNVLNTVDTLVQKLLAAMNSTEDNQNETIEVKTKNVALLVAPTVENHEVILTGTFNNVLEIFKTTEGNGSTIVSKELVVHERLSVITIPKEDLKENDSIAYIIYRTPFLFPINSININALKVGTMVHSVMIGNRRILKEPITMDFEKTAKHFANRNGKCSFWEIAENIQGVGHWSNAGCWKVIETINRTKCQCDHLTNFAVLFDVSQTGYNPVSLQIITKIGCGISLVGLTITVVTYLCSKNLRRKLTSKILVNLCLTMVILLVIFLTAVEKTTPRLFCQFVAGFIQYLLLSMFIWMAVEGVNLYRNVVMVFKARREGRFLKITSAIAYGFPLIVVVINVVLAPHSLGNERFCVVHGQSFYFGLVFPVLTILLMNFIVLTLTVKTIYQADKTMTRTKDIKNFSIRLMRISFSCACIMGLTWVFGALAIENTTIVFQWLFTIFNSLQGFLIFVFHAVRNEDVIKEWKKIMPKKKRFTENSAPYPSSFDTFI